MRVEQIEEQHGSLTVVGTIYYPESEEDNRTLLEMIGEADG